MRVINCCEDVSIIHEPVQSITEKGLSGSRRYTAGETMTDLIFLASSPLAPMALAMAAT